MSRLGSYHQLSDLVPLWKEILADTLFPLFCLGCERYGHWLCPDCSSRLPRRMDQRCPLCVKVLTPEGQRCFSCKDNSGLDGLYASSYYHSPLLSRVIHTYKYRFVADLAPVLGAFLVTVLQNTRLPLPDLITCVPLHERRLRFRGFNQAELLAAYVAANLTPHVALPFQNDALLRVRSTAPQMKTSSRLERLNNLTEAFACTPGHEGIAKGKNIWVIDDVSTTGATLSECAKVLKRAHAKSVFGIVLAR